MAFLSTCDGLSIVEESVFENRLTHGNITDRLLFQDRGVYLEQKLDFMTLFGSFVVKDLQKLGAKIHTHGRSTAFIYGKEKGK